MARGSTGSSVRPRADELGPSFGADLTAAEVRYLMQHEWARTADDVLWRRTKLGLHCRRRSAMRSLRIMAGEGARAVAC